MKRSITMVLLLALTLCMLCGCSNVSKNDAKFAVGNHVTLGTYPQTAEGTDSTPIEWIVLDRDGNKALLISRYILDEQCFNTTNDEETQWEYSFVREWMSGTFFNTAFTTTEQKAILTSKIENSSLQGYSEWESHGRSTEDRVFLLSVAEANQYFNAQSYAVNGSNNVDSRAQATAYALKKGAYTSEWMTSENQLSSPWMLRTHGKFKVMITQVGADGALASGDFVKKVGIRPAIWVNIDAAVFN